jgi:hypothetical protein
VTPENDASAGRYAMAIPTDRMACRTCTLPYDLHQITSASSGFGSSASTAALSAVLTELKPQCVSERRHRGGRRLDAIDRLLLIDQVRLTHASNT